ncbi:MAG: lysylphosphatidylglycerol synthase domain-containing protein [Oryzihumus sp.]
MPAVKTPLARDRRRLLLLGAGVALVLASAAYLHDAIHLRSLASAASALLRDPVPLLLALGAYAAAFGLRGWAWTRVLTALTAGQAWAALHVSLLGNHVLPLRLGEALRVTSVLRRTSLPAAPVTASAFTLRVADLLAVMLLALVAAPHVVLTLGGAWVWLGVGGAALALAAGLATVRRLPALRLPGPAVAASAVLAWVLEASVLYAVAQVSGHPVGALDAVAVTAVTIAAQTVALTPGGFGTYEAAATAALVALGVPAGPAFAVALLTHAVKTGYALVLGAAALVAPGPGYFGRFRLARELPPRPQPLPVGADAPVVAIIPVHNEEATVGTVVERLPRDHAGRPVVALVIDDGSTDASAARAAAAGARVVALPANLGLGAAVRRGLAEASALGPAAVVYLDADLEYDPRELGRLADPVLAGEADYVVGSRFAGQIRRMLPHRRFGNQVLTRWVRWMTRRPELTDGQSGYRAFSPRAAATAEVVHDYNYAQVLTLDLLGKGFTYAEVPIDYAFRRAGDSFVRLGRYLRRVLPAVHRELNTASVLDAVPGEPAQGLVPRVLVEGAVRA